MPNHLHIIKDITNVKFKSISKIETFTFIRGLSWNLIGMNQRDHFKKVKEEQITKSYVH